VGNGVGGLVAQAETSTVKNNRLARNHATGEDGLHQQMIMSKKWMPD